MASKGQHFIRYVTSSAITSDTKHESRLEQSWMQPERPDACELIHSFHGGPRQPRFIYGQSKGSGQMILFCLADCCGFEYSWTSW